MLAVAHAEAMAHPTLEALVEQVLAGDAAAWQALWRGLAPKLDAMLRRVGFLGRLASSEDHRRSVAVEVMARLTQHDHARLRRYAEARLESPTLNLVAWLTVVVKRVAIDYLRAQPEYIDRRKQPGATAPGGWRELATLPPDSQLPRIQTSITSRAAARQLLEVAGALLDADQRQALAAWLEGRSFEEIARDLALPAPREAEKKVRAALERIRRHARKAKP
jgi:DNA-directed RNA polymerase specialized sigma24 family protein